MEARDAACAAWLAGNGRHGSNRVTLDAHTIRKPHNHGRCQDPHAAVDLANQNDSRFPERECHYRQARNAPLAAEAG